VYLTGSLEGNPMVPLPVLPCSSCSEQAPAWSPDGAPQMNCTGSDEQDLHGHGMLDRRHHEVRSRHSRLQDASLAGQRIPALACRMPHLLSGCLTCLQDASLSCGW